MPRPPRCKWVRHEPRVRLFGPKDTPPGGVIDLPVEGVEALRLIELEGLDQEEAARSMGVSRQTLGRVLARARGILARALVEGLDLVVEGGAYRVVGPGPGRGRGRRRRCRGGRGRA